MRKCLLAVLAVVTLTFPAGSGAASSDVLATPDGTIVDGDTSGLDVLQVLPGLVVETYDVAESPADPVIFVDPPPGNFKTTFWGYEAAATGARILQYTSPSGFTGPPIVAGPTCMPPFTENGRGIAFDPLDANLWYTRVNGVTLPAFGGDGFIHKVTPPPLCALVTSIPFGDGPGGTVQDDIGALDVDQGSKHIWAAGYRPVIVAGAARSFLYLVNRNNGKIIHSCSVPFGGGGVGNDTLAYFRDGTGLLPGSGQYLLTDAGEPLTPLNGNALLVIDTAHCKGGAAVSPVAMFPKGLVGMTGIDFEYPGLISADLVSVRNHGGPPFAAFTPLGLWGNTFAMEDISLCAFRALLGGDGNDMCPYP